MKKDGDRGGVFVVAESRLELEPRRPKSIAVGMGMLSMVSLRPLLYCTPTGRWECGLWEGLVRYWYPVGVVGRFRVGVGEAFSTSPLILLNLSLSCSTSIRL